MTTIIQPKSNKGSLRDIQVLINDYPLFLESKINKFLKTKPMNIKFVSPLKNDYVEYRDNDFLKALNLPNLTEKLSLFWPKNGPQWDGLGLSDNGKRFLFEAKANLPELKSPPCKATSKDSILKIDQAIIETKKAMSIDIPIDVNWKGQYYQYTNRLAHLHFLRKNKIDAYLIFIYFVGDKSVNGPNTRNEWFKAIKCAKNSLSIPVEHNLSRYILDIFIDVKDIGF